MQGQGYQNKRPPQSMPPQFHPLSCRWNWTLSVSYLGLPRVQQSHSYYYPQAEQMHRSPGINRVRNCRKVRTHKFIWRIKRPWCNRWRISTKNERTAMETKFLLNILNIYKVENVATVWELTTYLPFNYTSLYIQSILASASVLYQRIKHAG